MRTLFMNQLDYFPKSKYAEPFAHTQSTYHDTYTQQTHVYMHTYTHARNIKSPQYDCCTHYTWICSHQHWPELRHKHFTELNVPSSYPTLLYHTVRIAERLLNFVLKIYLKLEKTEHTRNFLFVFFVFVSVFCERHFREPFQLIKIISL